MKSPYLVQRVKINRPIDVKKTFGQNCSMDYMGSSEFEWGALPKSLRRITAKLGEWQVRLSPLDMIICEGSPLRIGSYLPEKEFNEYYAYIRKMWDGKYDRRNLKERVCFNDPRLETNPRYKEMNLYRHDLWWDIENDVMWSFDKHFMKNTPLLLLNTREYMFKVDGEQGQIEAAA